MKFSSPDLEICMRPGLIFECDLTLDGCEETFGWYETLMRPHLWMRRDLDLSYLSIDIELNDRVAIFEDDNTGKFYDFY